MWGVCGSHLMLVFCPSVLYPAHAALKNLFYCFPMFIYLRIISLPIKPLYSYSSTPLMTWEHPDPLPLLTAVNCLP